MCTHGPRQVAKVVPLENLPTLLGGKVEIDAEYTSVGPWDDPRWDPALLPPPPPQKQEQQQQQQQEQQEV